MWPGAGCEVGKGASHGGVQRIVAVARAGAHNALWAHSKHDCSEQCYYKFFYVFSCASSPPPLPRPEEEAELARALSDGDDSDGDASSQGASEDEGE